MTWPSQILSNSVRGWAMRVLQWSKVSERSAVALRRCGPCGGAFAADVFASALGDACRFTATAAQVIELGASDRTAAHHLDRGDARRMERKDPFHPFAIGNLAQCEVRVDPGILAGDADALEGLDALALAFDDAQADAHRVPGLEWRHRPAGDQPGDLLGFELL